MRVVLDTNVIVSAAISPHSPPAQIHSYWFQGRIELLVSPPLLAEYRRALAYDQVRGRHKKSDAQLDALIRDYELGGVLIQPDFRLAVVNADPDDNRVLECALAGVATHIISGDRHLLGLGTFEGIPILEPRAFVRLLDEDRSRNDPE